MSKPTSHLKLTKSDAHARVLTCGAPERAQWISTFLEGSKEVAKNREYHSYLGRYNGQNILVCSHGVGASGAAICFHELIEAGAQSIIRLGTCGALYDDSKIGDIIIAEGAARLDGVSRQMVPVEYPAVPDFELTRKLKQTAGEKNVSTRHGIVLTSDLFYPGPIGAPLELYKRMGVIAVEMECSALFVIGRLNNIKTASILVADGNPLLWDKGHYDPHGTAMRNSIESAIQVTLKALSA